ncbi:plastocyanin/azurin family copper-binding protein [Methanolobus sp. ZRKC2]|uniref:plastocyanin/azurin family copper-binding protein n=1 Tax=Methanolobus sp. ZRKC2 TaxID=3125783 RepID=UPI0032489906
MKSGIIVLLILMLVFSAFGCAETQEDNASAPAEPTDADTPSGDTSSVQSELPEPNGTDVYTYITEENNYRNWDLWPLKEEKYASTSIHGPLLTTYVSENTASAIQDRTGTLPFGSIAVRESYDSDGELEEIGVRYKVEGYNPEHNDWFWAAYTPEGEIIAEGRVEACQDCHSVEADNDYIYTSYIIDTPFREIDVEIRDFRFNPQSVTIEVGDTVKWTNTDSAVHIVDGGFFRSPALSQGESYSYTFTDPGTYNYICSVHPYQTSGQIVVTG